MKKLVTLILTAILILTCCAGLTACKNNEDWDGTTIKNWGTAGDQKGGFVAETENNLYFINGRGNSNNDNTFGTPVQGALMGITKADFKAGKFDKAQIVVPKLFTATDYYSGIYVYGDYVYYGTPNTEKNASGEIANSEMIITKTKLDGTETTAIVKLPANSTEYRILEKNNQIYVLYYDNLDMSIKVFVNGKTTVLAKTDAKTNVGSAENGYESLEEYAFSNNIVSDGNAVVFCTRVYSEKYYEEKAEAEGASYERAIYDYNNVYAYKAGDSKATLIINGKENQKSTALTYKNNEFLFYQQKDVNGKVEVFGADINTISANNLGTKIEESALDYLKDTNLIVSLDEVYVVDFEENADQSAEVVGGDVYKTTLLEDEKLIKEKVVVSSTIRALVNKIDDELYFISETDELRKVKIGEEDAKEIRVSTGVVATSWYDQKFMEMDGKTYLIYCDSSTLGCSYLRVINLTDAVEEGENLDDQDETNDVYYLTGNEFIAIKTAVHKAVEFTYCIDQAVENGDLKYIEENGALIFEKLDEATEVYNKLSKEVKDQISDAYKAKYKNMLKAAELAKKYYELRDIKTVADTSTLKTAYESAKTLKNQIINSAEYELKTIVEYINNNFNYFYQEASKIFDKADK